MAALSPNQERWLRDHPEFVLYNQAKFGVGFQRWGVLYREGRFAPMDLQRTLPLDDGCVMVGVPFGPRRMQQS